MYDWLKGLTFFASPSGLLILGVLCSGAWALARPSRWSRATAAVFGALLACAAFLPVGFLTLRLIEHRFPPWRGGKPVAGIVMLDGRLQRFPYDLAYARQYPHARVIFSGRPERDYSGFKVLLDAGLDPARSIGEGRSRDTYENALFSLALAKPKAGETWLLVTSASHMPRAMAVFRRVGFPVTAAPVDFRTERSPKLFGAAASEALTMFDDAFRELWALVSYRLSGRTRELWPKP